MTESSRLPARSAARFLWRRFHRFFGGDGGDDLCRPSGRDVRRDADARAARAIFELSGDRDRRRRPRAAARAGWTRTCQAPSGRSRELKAPVNHYKVCSTLELLADRWSIGRAIDIGVPIFGERRRGGELAAAGRRRAGDRTLSGVRQSLCRVSGPRLSPRPASGHAATSGHADGRGGRALARRQADLAPDRPH